MFKQVVHTLKLGCLSLKPFCSVKIFVDKHPNFRWRVFPAHCVDRCNINVKNGGSLHWTRHYSDYILTQDNYPWSPAPAVVTALLRRVRREAEDRGHWATIIIMSHRSHVRSWDTQTYHLTSCLLHLLPLGSENGFVFRPIQNLYRL